MTATSPNIDGHPYHRRDWFRGFRALRRLANDTHDVGHVYTVLRAVNGRSNVDNFLRLQATSTGRRMCQERVELAPYLMDDAWLDSFAPGTLGAAYREFLRSEGLSEKGLVEAGYRALGEAGHKTDPDAWFDRRMRDTHDIWHVLAGYGRETLGELCEVAFTYSQVQAWGWAWIAWGGYLRARGGKAKPFRDAIKEGFARGRVTRLWMPGEDYAAMFAEPLEVARERLGITPPVIYDAVSMEMRDMKMTVF